MNLRTSKKAIKGKEGKEPNMAQPQLRHEPQSIPLRPILEALSSLSKTCAHTSDKQTC
jgi:hypothetical protein